MSFVTFVTVRLRQAQQHEPVSEMQPTDAAQSAGCHVHVILKDAQESAVRRPAQVPNCADCVAHVDCADHIATAIQLDDANTCESGRGFASCARERKALSCANAQIS